MKKELLILLILPIIGFTQNPNYSEDVAPIVYDKCLKCHHNGGIAALSLETYGNTVSNSGMIQHVTSTGEMPPWPPDTLYQDYAYQTAVRWACDENYNPNGSQTGSAEILTILDITIPAGKGLMCENTGIIKMLDTETNTYGTAYGENQAYYTYLYYQFDTFTSGISCTAMTLGSGSVDTTFSVTTLDRSLDYDEEYRLYLVYTLVDVEDHIV